MRYNLPPYQGWDLDWSAQEMNGQLELILTPLWGSPVNNYHNLTTKDNPLILIYHFLFCRSNSWI